MTIVVVEDNDSIRDAVTSYLELEDFNVFGFPSIGAAENKLASLTPDLFILDVMLPDGDGFRFAKRLKTRMDVPILFLTARDAESDRITGLELGADDYVVKPFSVKELVLRVKAVLKRSSVAVQEKNDSFVLDEAVLEIHQSEHRLLENGAAVELTQAEWNILTFLASKAPQVFSRLQLLEYCLESIAEASERTIDTHIKNIRRKLNAPWISTVRGFGYRFDGKAE